MHYEVDIEREFSAAHNLKGYPGNCAEVHGHNWKVQVTVRVEELDSVGIGIDFRLLRQRLDGEVKKFDHKNLNLLDEFTELNPSSENLARLIFENLSESLNDQRVQVHRVRVCESPGSGASYGY